jgi:nitroreductase
MKVSQALQARRSIKYFDSHHKMSTAERERLMQACLHSPTAFNIQNWRFINVTSTELRREMRQAAWDQPQITDASLLLVLCMDLMAWSRQPERYWRNTPPEVAEQLVPEIKHSCGIVAQSLMLMAQEMGYDSCAMDGFDFKRVGHLIDLPEDHEICMMLAIGKPIRAPWPRGGQLALEEVFFENSFPSTE